MHLLCALPTTSPTPPGERGARAIAAAVTDLLHDRRISRIKTEVELVSFAPAALGPEAAAASAGSGDKGAAAAAALARVLLFTDKPKTTVLYKALSIAYAGRLRFGQVLKGEGDVIAEKLGVEDYPTLLVIKVSRVRALW